MIDAALAAEICVPKDVKSVSVIGQDDSGVFQDATGQQYFLAEVYSEAFDRMLIGQNAVLDAAFTAYPIGPANRWDQRPAWIVRSGSNQHSLLQSDLLERGHAIYMPKLSGGPCADYLRKMERHAERSGRELWADGRRLPVYSAAIPDVPLAAAGTYGILRGRIVSLGKTRSTRYLNFGRYWKVDFTVTLAATDAPLALEGLAEDGVSFEDLDGRAVEIRGVIEDQDGPLIAWRRAEQLVVLEE